MELHGGDTEARVFFYEHEFYVLSNFSSFEVFWKGRMFPTSEHVYHWERFDDRDLKLQVLLASSAHDAFKFAQANKDKQRSDWHDINLGVMKEILRAKVDQHPYVKKKLLETGDRDLIEDSWRDDFWGCGSNKDGQNHMGRLWMEIREEIREKLRQEYEQKRRLYSKFKSGQHYLSPEASEELRQELDILAKQIGAGKEKGSI